MKECVVIDGVRSANVRAHAQKGWFRNVRIDEVLTKVYDGLFARNPQVKPEEIEAIYCGCANQTGQTFDVGRLAWLAGGYPDVVAANTICQQCPSGMSAIEHAARAIMAGEGDTYIAAGVEDMLHVPMGAGADFPPRVAARYGSINDVLMGPTAEKVAEMWKLGTEEMQMVAYWSNKKAAAARDAGKFDKEIIPIEGHDDDGNPIMVKTDQWIRDDITMESMAKMKSPFKEGGVVTAALSSPLTAGACAVLLMDREKADKLGLDYTIKYKAGAMAGNDPTIMGVGPIPAIQKVVARAGITTNDVGIIELNEAFASQALICVRELGFEQNAPFEKTNIWGGALALGHPLGESGARLVVTLNNIMKTDKSDAKYGIAALCGGFGNGNATLWERVK